LINKLKAEVHSKEQELQRLNDYSKNIDTAMEARLNPNLGQLASLRVAVDESAYKLEESRMETDILKHMYNRDVDIYVHKKKPITRINSDLRTMEQWTSSIKSKINQIENEKRNFENENYRIMATFSDTNKYFTHAYQGYVKEFKKITLTNAVQMHIK